MRISDWSSDVCSSDLRRLPASLQFGAGTDEQICLPVFGDQARPRLDLVDILQRRGRDVDVEMISAKFLQQRAPFGFAGEHLECGSRCGLAEDGAEAEHGGNEIRFHERTFRTDAPGVNPSRSEEHTSELQSLMRISYAVFCLKKKKKHIHIKIPQLIYRHDQIDNSTHILDKHSDKLNN